MNPTSKRTSLANDLMDAAQEVHTANPEVYAAIEEYFGGPGALNDADEVRAWVRGNPDQAGDFLEALRQALARMARPRNAEG